MLHVSRKHPPQHHVSYQEVKHHGHNAPYHPLEERYRRSLRSQLVQETNHNNVRGRADGRHHTTDATRIGRHQHQSRGILIVRQVDGFSVGSHHFADSLQQSQGNGKHHRCRSRIADPSRAEHTRQPDGQEYLSGRIAHPLHRHDTVGHTLVQPIHHHTLRQQETTHE